MTCEKQKNIIIEEKLFKYKYYSKALEKGYWNGNLKHCNDVTEEWLGGIPIKDNIVIKL